MAGEAVAIENSSAKEIINSMSDDKKKALKSWYFYDWANQAYALTVMTVIAPALMAALYNTATGTQSGDSFYAWVLTFSMLFVVVTAPALGVIADKRSIIVAAFALPIPKLIIPRPFELTEDVIGPPIPFILQSNRSENFST